MKTYFFLFIAAFILSACNPVENDKNGEVSVIPVPQKITYAKGQFEIGEKTKILIPAGNKELAELGNLFVDLFSASTGLTPKLENSKGNKAGRNSITLKIDENIQLGDEGYQLSVAKKHVVIVAKNEAGLFYGMQTFLQLLSNNNGSGSGKACTVPCLQMEDKPRFKYRGILIDVARHFHSKEAIKKWIEVLSSYKFNYLQLHLTDDQGWRLEIKKYPKLTEIGSVREETLIGHHNSKEWKFDGKKYGGYYTQDDMREIIAHAQKYRITVIPEIEMPGHSVAALTAYPELGCTGGPYKLRTVWGISDDVQCAGNDHTFRFIEDVLSEVAELFPGEYIHIGGDESPKMRWEECEKCQKRIKDEGLKDEHELQSYFIKRAENVLNAKGKKLVGWDEILEGGLAPNAIVMSWRGTKGGIKAAKMGHHVVMTPNSHCYLDYYQSEDRANEPLAIGGHLPLSKVYAFNPTEGLTDEESKYVLGGQGNTWTEYIPTPGHLEYMIFPRALALSEVLWTSDHKKDYNSFLLRAKEHEARLKSMNVNFRKIVEKKGEINE